MFCIHCGEAHEPGDQFCGTCGAAFEEEQIQEGRQGEQDYTVLLRPDSEHIGHGYPEQDYSDENYSQPGYIEQDYGGQSYTGQDAEPPIKKRKKWPLVLILVLVLVIGAGAAAYFVVYPMLVDDRGQAASTRDRDEGEDRNSEENGERDVDRERDRDRDAEADEQHELVGIWASTWEFAGRTDQYVEFNVDGSGTLLEGFGIGAPGEEAVFGGYEAIPITWSTDGNQLTIRLFPDTSDYEPMIFEYEIVGDELIVSEIGDDYRYVFTRAELLPTFDIYSSSSEDDAPAADDAADADVSADDDEEEPLPEEPAIKHFQVIERRMTWDEAQAYAASLDGFLATLTSYEEYLEVVALLEETDLRVVWLGGYRKANGNFGWLTDEDFEFTNWLPGEPNNEGGIENYIAMLLVDGRWMWADVPGDVSPYYGEAIVGFVIAWLD